MPGLIRHLCIFSYFWIQAFAGMTAIWVFAGASINKTEKKSKKDISLINQTNKESLGNIKSSSNIRQLYITCIILTLTVLMLDFLTPLGVAMGVLYILVVLISLWSPGKRFTVIIAVICSILTVTAFFYKPPVAEMWKAVFNRILALSAIWITAILGLQRKYAEDNREKAIREREKALDDIKILNGLIPICSSCKKIRDDRGYWNHLEVYIKNHSEAKFSHGICPECAKILYPELYGKKSE